ncbi:NitT/TauT family transport system substrate-binding protein [Acetitomaculum ruminis DSM 5522]|uniref:NitT/TauT family transport system substrate-binding protein n=1 Tax=Acetitomaculum ruminis DSM 5522 TaxID=1120918 RepID=A0A1I1ADJ8_9FIRM|nr:ABC transporter substrate-binding protein [Acetitomaculum ruminis]SFB35436.1 NitT/TauT family transport system substrate-binding protein [Acetitomaculum ruminis DSM 5522]
MKKILIPFLFLTLTLSLVLTGCGNKTSEAKSEKEVVKIAYLPITHSLAALEEAKELEAGENGNIEVELVKYGSWPELLDALNSGQVDGASVLIELAMKSKSEGVGIKAVALGHKDGNVIVVSNDVKDGADLKGRTIAIPHRQSSHNILVNLALEKNGLTINDINVVELAPTEMPSALAAGTVDGYCVAEPFGAVGVSNGTGKVLYESNELWEDSACCALVLTDKFIDERTDVAKEYVAQYKEAGNSLTDDEAEAVAKEYLNQKDDVLDISLQWISYDDLELTKDVYNSLVEKVKKYGLSDNPPVYEDFVLSDFD